MPKIYREKNDTRLILEMMDNNGKSLRTTIPKEFVKRRNLKEHDLLIIEDKDIKTGKMKIEVNA